MATHYDITMANDVVTDAHCEITMGNDVTRDIHCDITTNNDTTICTYHDITMDNDEHFLLYILCSMPNRVILLWVEWNKNKNKFMFDQSWLENIFVVFVKGLVKYSYTNTAHVFSPD